jgi:hypothetical protein
MILALSLVSSHLMSLHLMSSSIFSGHLLKDYFWPPRYLRCSSNRTLQCDVGLCGLLINYWFLDEPLALLAIYTVNK